MTKPIDNSPSSASTDPDDVAFVEGRMRSIARQAPAAPSVQSVRRRARRIHGRRSAGKRILATAAAVLIIGSIVGIVRDRSATLVVVTDPAATASPLESDPDGATDALLAAVKAGETETALILLEAGVAPGTVGRFGLTPLMIASLRDDEATVRALLRYGADPSHRSDAGDAALHHAARFATAATVNSLLDGGAAIDQPNPERSGETPLMRAASRGDVEIVRLLLDRGADPNAADDRHRSVLHYTLDSANTHAVVELLASVGATWLDRDGTVVQITNRPLDQVVAELRETN